MVIVVIKMHIIFYTNSSSPGEKQVEIVGPEDKNSRLNCYTVVNNYNNPSVRLPSGQDVHYSENFLG